MGLEVGVIPTIEYLDRPHEAARGFISHLSNNAEEADWHVIAPMNKIVEYTRENLCRLMERYITAGDLTVADVRGIRGWVNSLPWKNDYIMLHFGW